MTGAPENNKNATKHGGAAARKALTTGEEFTGPAREAELAIREELAAPGGRLELVTRNVARLQACSDLYWNALVDAGERGDMKKIASYSKTFGWLASKSLSALQQLREEQDRIPNSMDYEQILANQDGEE